MTTEADFPVAGPSSRPAYPLGQGLTPYHDTSQFRNWRYSPAQLRELRQILNTQAQEILAKNQELEKEAQISLGHAFTDPPPPTTYLSVDEELLLVQFYCDQASKVVRDGFQLPDVVESTAITYLKRFYLKNSVMEWHPKLVMPTCVYLAAKTTNYPIFINDFKERFTKLNTQEILDSEFLVAQSLAFEFWVRGPDKALRGWILDLQSQPGSDFKKIQQVVPGAFEYLTASRLTDLEHIYTPSQISLACLRMADTALVDAFLDWRYQSAEGDVMPFGCSKDWLRSTLDKLALTIQSAAEGPDLKRVKGIDKRLKSCTNPEKVPGTALYIKRKQEREAADAAARAEKSLRIKREMDDGLVFGDIIDVTRKNTTADKPMSPRVSLSSDRSVFHSGGDASKPQSQPEPAGDPTRTDRAFKESGMGTRDEALGLVVGGTGLEAVGELREQD